MNKTSVFSNIRFAATALFFAAVFSTGSSFAKGSENSTEPAASSAKALDVKYVTSSDEGYIFNVNYNNVASTPFELIIKDETGEVLYSKGFNEKNFSKKYQLSKSFIKAIFIIRTKEGDQSFEASVSTRQMEDVVVSRL